MVGYIEDAVIASQVRIRFDAAFDDQFPDLAEFFYAKCGCYRGLATAIPAAYDPNAPGPGLGVPNNVNYQELTFRGEYAPVSRFSAFFELPLRWLQPQGFQAVPPFPAFGSSSGVGDVRFGVKLGLIASDQRSLTVQLRAFVPSGDASKGLGTNHSAFEPALLYREQVTSRFGIEGQIGDSHPIGGSAGVPTNSSQSFAGDVFFYGIGPSYTVYEGNRVKFTPVVELVGWHVFSGFATNPGGPILGAAFDVSGTNIVNLKFGARTTVGNHDSFYVGYGHALTNPDWYDNIVRVEYRHTF